MVLIRKSGNMYWELIRMQKDSVQMLIKEELTEVGYWRVFQETYSRVNYSEEKCPAIILHILNKHILPEEYKVLPISDYSKLISFYRDMKKKELVNGIMNDLAINV